jgi:phosphoribosylanthranilate isomerase
MTTHTVPTITLTGADERTSLPALNKLTSDGRGAVEIGLLYTVEPEGRHRYPSRSWLSKAAAALSGPIALHVCGSAARAQLQAQTLTDLVAHVQRIQVNGTLASQVVEQLCELYPRHIIITQHNAANDSLLQVRAANHAVLVDGSGGRGISPACWQRPQTNKAVGFAGGLGPENLKSQLPVIAKAAEGAWWVDMEQSLRTHDDWFDAAMAAKTAAAFREACIESLGSQAKSKSFR